MDKWLLLLQHHAPYAHYTIFGCALLAGLNFPVSIDLLMILSAYVAASIVPEHTLYLFLSIFLGCSVSAWLSYWVGRLLGPKLLKRPLFTKIFPPKKIEKVRTFHERKGFYAMIVGRFIPFGVRNCLFMSSGMSKIPFRKFALMDGLACFLWSSTCFSLYYLLGKNIDVLYHRVKFMNLIIFFAFSVTVITIIWYKKKKRKRSS